MARRDIVVMGASAGGLNAFRVILSKLPSDFPGSVFITLHTAPNGPGCLPEVLAQKCLLPVSSANGDETIQPGRVYVARPNLHLIVRRGRVRDRFMPKENGTRPAVDPMFRSAARAYGGRVIGVVLTGNLDDGTDGLGIIKDEGGIAIVQDPKEALYPSMPASAISNVSVDYILPLAEIPPVLIELVSSEVTEVKAMAPEERIREPHIMTCPGCGGVLREYRQGKRVYFECQVGHRYTVEAVMAEQDRQVEESLWGSVALLKQKEEMVRTLASDARSLINSVVDPSLFEKQAQEIRKTYQALAKLLEEKGPLIFGETVPKDISEGNRVTRIKQKNNGRRSAGSRQ